MKYIYVASHQRGFTIGQCRAATKQTKQFTFAKSSSPKELT